MYRLARRGSHLRTKVVQLPLRLLRDGDEQHRPRVNPHDGIAINQVCQVLRRKLILLVTVGVGSQRGWSKSLGFICRHAGVLKFKATADTSWLSQGMRSRRGALGRFAGMRA